MNRLDQHVSAVQNRLMMERFFHALSWTLLIGAGIALAGVAVDKLAGWLPPQPDWWLIGIASSAVVAAALIAWRRRPDRMSAAAAIDEKLGLEEKISTALFARQSTDPFAVAAVRDAEVAAGAVTLRMGTRFPLTFPRMAYLTIIVAAAAWLLAVYVAPMDLFGRAAAHHRLIVQQQAEQNSRKQLQDALAVVNSVPEALANDDKIKVARADLTAQLAHGANDPAQANRSALKALQDVDAAAEQQIKNNVHFAQAKADEKMWKQIGEQPITETGPVNDVRRELADGKFTQAINDLSNVVNNFDKMDKEQQKKAAAQMKQLAQQLQHQGNPTAQQQQQVQQQLQQMGLNQQQSQQAQQLLQQAASGDKQAQQQLQQMAKQVMSQMNNGQGPTAQQKQQMQQMMQQMQAAANNQAQAQQLAQAAQQMAHAMQQQAGQQGQQQGQQPGQKQGQNGQGQQQAQQSGGSQQGMNGAMQQMQQQLQQMQAVAGDAQQIAAAQQAAQGALDGGGAGGADGAQQPGQWPGNNQPPGAQGGKGQGGGVGGHGFGGQGAKAEAPYTVKPEFSPSQDNETGRLLATSYVKAGSIKGESRAQLKDVAASAIKDPTDEIDQDRISRQAQSVVRKYFSSMEDDAATTQP